MNGGGSSLLTLVWRRDESAWLTFCNGVTALAWAIALLFHIPFELIALVGCIGCALFTIFTSSEDNKKTLLIRQAHDSGKEIVLLERAMYF